MREPKTSTRNVLVTYIDCSCPGSSYLLSVLSSWDGVPQFAFSCGKSDSEGRSHGCLPQKSLVWEGRAPELHLSFALQTVKVSFAPFGAG